MTTPATIAATAATPTASYTRFCGRVPVGSSRWTSTATPASNAKAVAGRASALHSAWPIFVRLGTSTPGCPGSGSRQDACAPIGRRWPCGRRPDTRRYGAATWAESGTWRPIPTAHPVVYRRGMAENALDQAGEARLYRALRAVLAPRAVGRRAGRPARRGAAAGRAPGPRPARRRRPGVPGPVRPPRDGALAGLGRRRVPGLPVPRLDLRPGRASARGSPSSHGTNIPAKARIQRYAAAEHAGLVWVCLEAGPRRRRPGRRAPAARVPRVGRRRLPADQDPAVRLALQRRAAGRELRRLQPLRLGPRGDPRRPVATRRSRTTTSSGPRRRCGSGSGSRSRRRTSRATRRSSDEDPARAVALHPDDAVHGPPRPAAPRRTPLRAVRGVVSRCPRRRPGTSPGTRATTTSNRSATRRSSTSSS